MGDGMKEHKSNNNLDIGRVVRMKGSGGWLWNQQQYFYSEEYFLFRMRGHDSAVVFCSIPYPIVIETLR